LFKETAMKNKFPSRRQACAFGALAALLAGTPAVHLLAQEKPDAPGFELIVPFGPGGGADQLARENARLLGSLGVGNVTVNNIPGATGNAAIARLLAAPSDGRTVAVLTADTFSLLAYLNPGWKLADIVPLAIMIKQPSALFLPQRSRFNTWAGFEKQARQRPNTLRVAITGLGSPDYLALQQLFSKGIRLAPVPLANPEERYRAVLQGQADALYEQPGDVQPLIDAKLLRPVLAFGAVRLAAFKEVPTSQELGFGDARNQFRALVVKAGTDPAKVQALCAALDKVAALPQYTGFLDRQGALKNSYVPGKDAAVFLQGELDAMKKIVDSLPFHARFLFSEAELERYVEPF
jgi:tripartite-type tricarboxylate transporter receptor subunit TctC